MSDSIHFSEIFSSIQGEGLLAGRRQLFLRLCGCNLDCRYCDTDHGQRDVCRVESEPGSGRFHATPQPLPLGWLLDLVRGWCGRLPGAHHSISLTGGEPLLCAETLIDWLPHLRKLLPIHLETNGTMHLALERVIDHLDYISMDMKIPSTSGCTEHLWEPHRAFLQIAAASTVSVKVVVGDETSGEEIQQVCEIISEVAPQTPLFLQPVSASGHVAVAAAHLMRLQEIASSRVADVRVIPQMHLMLGAP